MPELDGLDRDAPDPGGPALRGCPIIAMTANAMKADLDACAAAGMSDHVTKPIDRRALVRTLRRWLEPRLLRGRRAARPAAAPPPTPRDPETARRRWRASTSRQAVGRLGLDLETVRRLLLRMADGLAALLAGLRTAVASGDPRAAAAQAHTIAGAAGNLGADELRARRRR